MAKWKLVPLPPTEKQLHAVIGTEAGGGAYAYVQMNYENAVNAAPVNELTNELILKVLRDHRRNITETYERQFYEDSWTETRVCESGLIEFVKAVFTELLTQEVKA
jgi:hypothetical protein